MLCLALELDVMYGIVETHGYTHLLNEGKIFVKA